MDGTLVCGRIIHLKRSGPAQRGTKHFAQKHNESFDPGIETTILNGSKMACYDPVELDPVVVTATSCFDNKDSKQLNIMNSSLTDDNQSMFSKSTDQSICPVVWDVFESRNLEMETTRSSSVEYLKIIFKLLFTCVLCLLVLFFGFLNKLTLVQINHHLNIKSHTSNQNCKEVLLANTTIVNDTTKSYTEVTYIWALFLCISVPNIQASLSLLQHFIFKNTQPIKTITFLWVMVVESFHSTGLFVLAYLALPQLEVTQALLVLEGIGILPSVFKVMQQKQQKPVIRLFNWLAIFGQSSIILYWVLVRPINDGRWHYLNLILPLSLIFISFQWWDNYLAMKPSSNVMKRLLVLRRNLQKTRTRTYLIVTIWKAVLCFILVVFTVGGKDGDCFEILFYREKIADGCLGGLLNLRNSGYRDEPLITALINVLSSFLCYQCVKTACRILCQISCFVLPLAVLTPLALICLSAIQINKLQWTNILETFQWIRTSYWNEYMKCSVEKEHILLGIIWVISLLIVANQIFSSKTERLASTEKLFVKPMYCAINLEQFLFLNKRRNDFRFRSMESRIRNYSRSSYPSTESASINLGLADVMKPRIFVCVTLWHESEIEMMKLLKSIFRLDIDQCARRHARQYFDLADPDYYTFEAHLVIDDAFDKDGQINYFVKQLMSVMDSALSCVHNIVLRMKPPTKYVTPYGGRLEWTLPGGNLFMIHMKNKHKIRSKKRWSQVMYMYWILGYRIMSVDGSVHLKQSIAENTYLLTLDGDIEFHPPSFLKLLDRMKKNPHVGAACGRIHPVGSGPLIWYQKFEYAISHWLQKSAEHVMGCVLCSPGCFSLFRGSALMDDNILSTYTSHSSQPIDYLQKDQGEDRWLSTLLLKRGYRVEYCAAADAMTFAPEGFKEFFNQRRRWMPSTLANTYDILSNWRTVVKHNNSISLIYLIYQAALMAISFISPGTIFVLLVGAINRAYPALSLTSTFLLNLVPIVIMILLCKYTSTKTQLNFAIILTMVYTVVMMTVLAGLCLEIAGSLFCSTTTIFAALVFIAFVSAALLHPQEFSAIFGGIVFLLAVPTMSIILVIYAMGNLHIVSWGTREVIQQNSELLSADGSQEVSSNGVSFLAPSPVSNTIQKKFQSFINTIRKCFQKSTSEQCDVQHQEILTRIQELESKLNKLRNQQIHECPSCTLESRIPVGFQQIGTENNAHPNVTVNPNHWYNNEVLGQSEIAHISPQESKFWKDFIHKYLLPLKSNPEIQKQKKFSLEKLRNKLATLYLLTNMSFVLLVLSLENSSLSNDKLTILISCNFNDVTKDKVRPLSVIFVIVFGLILICQMLAMLFHRASTVIHIIASTDLNISRPWQKKARSNTLQLIHDLQRLDKQVIYSDSILTTEECQESSSDNYMNQSHKRQPEWVNRLHNNQATCSSLEGHFKENFCRIASRTFAKSESEQIIYKQRSVRRHVTSLPVLEAITKNRQIRKWDSAARQIIEEHSRKNLESTEWNELKVFASVKETIDNIHSNKPNTNTNYHNQTSEFSLFATDLTHSTREKQFLQETSL